MSSYRVIFFFPKALKGIEGTHSLQMGKLRHNGLAQIPSMAGWRQLPDLIWQMSSFHWHSKTRSSSGAFPPGTTEHREHPPMQQEHLAQRCSTAMLGLRSASGAETGVSHSCREGWAVWKWEGPARPTLLPVGQVLSSFWMLGFSVTWTKSTEWRGLKENVH